VRQTRTKEGIVSSESATGLIVALDTLLTEDLLKEGLVRDVVRQCQLLRKEAGYTVEQRITAAISSGSDFAVKALNDSREHIATELLALELYINEEIEADLTKEVEIGDDTVTLSVKKA
jgi:isoleucyl-tRNA synthetase